MSKNKPVLVVNRFPLWKNILIFSVAIIAIIYALPNIFGQSVSLQVSANNAIIPNEMISLAHSTLDDNNIKVSRIEQVSNSSIDIVLKNSSQMQTAQTILQSKLGDDYTIALTDISNAPAWLDYIGAKQLNLGLDLKGGIYLMLEADTQAAVNARLDSVVGSIESTLEQCAIAVKSVQKASKQKTLDSATIPDLYTNSGYAVLSFNSVEARNKALLVIKNDFSKTQNNTVILLL